MTRMCIGARRSLHAASISRDGGPAYGLPVRLWKMVLVYLVSKLSIAATSLRSETGHLTKSY